MSVSEEALYIYFIDTWILNANLFTAAFTNLLNKEIFTIVRGEIWWWDF